MSTAAQPQPVVLETMLSFDTVLDCLYGVRSLLPVSEDSTPLERDVTEALKWLKAVGVVLDADVSENPHLFIKLTVLED